MTFDKHGTIEDMLAEAGFSRGRLQAMPPPLDLVGPTEIAELLNISRRTVFRYVARPGFPEPVGRVGRTTIWKRAAVERWAKQHLPLSEGRPPR